MNRRLAALLAPLLLAACTTTPAGEEPAPRAEAAPAAPTEAPRASWTEDFRREAVLVADEIRIVGPRGLLEHVVVQQDATNHSHDVEATPEGLVLDSVATTNAIQPIRAQLDGLSLAATRGLRVLESVNAVDVVVEANGEVYYRDIEAGKESRSPRVRLVGRTPR